jgi:hypothetical protein
MSDTMNLRAPDFRPLFDEPGTGCGNDKERLCRAYKELPHD